MNDRVSAERPSLWREAYALPHPVFTLVGRDQDLAAMHDALRQGARMLTLTGAAGIGKTRLAVELAQQLNAGAEVSAFLRLAPLRDAALVPKLLASVCALDGWPDLPIDRFPPELHGVLVLDAFDHVRDAGASIVTLLERCPRLIVVITSHDALNLPMETAISLRPIDPNASQMLLQARAARCRDRAPEESDVVVTMGGNPLSLELFGGLLQTGRSPQIDPSADTGSTLNTLIEQAIDALPPHARRLFERLCVCAAGFEASAVATLADCVPSIEGDSSDHLKAMTELGLVRQPGTAAVAASFEIATAVREVGLSRLNESGELAAVRLAYANHLLARAAKVGELLSGPRRNAALAWFEREYAGLRLAFGSFVQMNRVQHARALAEALLPYWLIRRRFREARRWLTVALELTSPPYSDDSEVELLVALGLLELYLGNDAAARARALAGARPGTPVPQTGWRGAALATLGMLAAREGDLDRAIGLYRVYLEATRAAHDGVAWAPQLRAITRLALASAYLARGELEDAEYHATMALKRAISLGDPILVGYARVKLAAIAAAKPDLDTALELYRDGILLLIEQLQTSAASAGIVGLARIAQPMGATTVAARLLKLARAMLESGSPIPPFLVSYDLEELETLLSGETPGAIGEAPVLQSIDRLSGAAATVVECIDVLSGARTPSESTPVRKGRGGLSNRELEALCLAAEDMTDLEIADALFISKRTASDHMRNVIGKLGVNSRTGAVARALREGWCS